MKTKSRFIKSLPFLIILSVFLTCPLLPSPSHAAEMNDYCITPPFIVAGVKPNLLMILDNSASMYDLTYIDESPEADYCFDTSYNDANSYVGYFEPGEYYSYEGANGIFIPGAALPSSCTYRTDYVCLNITGTTADDFIAKGNFLNWLSSTKFDVQKKILTGGKYDTVNQLLIGESRGCVGRRFIKRISDFSDITFAVRGPNALEPDYTNPETQGGLTRIEIFKGTYDPNDRCQDAIDIWKEDDPLGQWMNAASDCLGISGGGGTASGRELATFIESVRGCYHIKNNIEDIEAGRKELTEANLMKNVTINNLKTHCTNVYTKDCPDPDDLTTCESNLNNETGGNYICARTVTHIAPSSPYYDFLGSDTTGFVGVCWNGSADKFVGSDSCINREFLHYCSGYGGAEVIDPTSGSSSDAADNVPALIRDASVRSLGDPLTPSGSVEKLFYVKVRKTIAPEGLIQDFADLIRFGAMSFNSFGSPSECDISGTDIKCPKRCSITTNTICNVDSDCPSGETCVTLNNLDGGEIIHYIKNYCSVTTTTFCKTDSDCPGGEECIAPIGDHDSGLIKSIDDIQAETWTPFAEGFYETIGYFAQRTSDAQYTRLNNTDFITETENPAYPDPVQYICQKNNVLLITDGMSTADLNSGVNNLVFSYNEGDGEIDTAVSATCPKYAGSRNLDDLAWLAKNRDIKDFDQTPDAVEINSRTITTHVVFSGTQTADPGECDPLTLMTETAENGGTALRQAGTPEELYLELRRTFQDIAGRAASGTAASVLASGEGSGANLVQAIFYPERSFSGTEIEWTGTLKNLWYHIDPYLYRSTIREDTTRDNTLNLTNDDIVHFCFKLCSTTTTQCCSVDSDCPSGETCTTDNLTKALLFDDSDGNSLPDSSTPRAVVYFENINSLWEAGSLLWTMSPASRVIYSTVDGSTKIAFSTANAATLSPWLQAENVGVAERIIEYVRGTDYNTPFCSQSVATTCTQDSDCPAGEECISFRNRTIDSNTWKLGDIINSTPGIVSWTPLNTYDETYLDESYEAFTDSSEYLSRGMVFVGSNAGMLHAFKLGDLELIEERFEKARLTGADLGKEVWAFIPKNALPYLRYMADEGYCHLYYVDLTPFVFDASIGTSGCAEADYWNCSKFDASGDPFTGVNWNYRWRTILIGGLRFGGACKNPTDSNSDGVADACTTDINGDGVVDNDDCVLRPNVDKGYSSYFALDITDPTNPQVLWEFTNENLGFSTSGPAVVRISTQTDGLADNTKNGRWFVVFGSGPTGPIDKDTHQFLGHSDQNLRFFVLDLATGSLLRTIDTGIPYAFAGSLVNSPIDFDQRAPYSEGFYQDDAVYVGFTKAEDSPPDATTKWIAGGVGRLYTKNSLNPADWTWSTVINNIGPVTASVSKLQDYTDKKVRLFFGTGRYFYKIADDIDDADPIGISGSTRKIYGLKEPCYTSSGIDFDCADPAGAPSEAVTAAGTTDEDGWYINLDSCTDSTGAEVACNNATAIHKAERNVTDPLATPIGAVLFTTTKPSADVCEFGGVSHLWAVYHKTGGAVSSDTLRGTVLLQVSTGSIEEVDLRSAFVEREGRRTHAFQGVAPSSQPRVAVPHKPMNKILHIQEK